MLASIVLALLAILSPQSDAQSLPAGAKADLGVPKRAVCRMAVDETTTVACAWRTRGGHLRIYVTTS